MKVKFTKTAAKDLRNISRYTLNKWGEQQKDKYISEIDSSIKLIAENYLIGKLRSEFDGEIRSKIIEKHIIFYRKKAELIEVLTILHQSMDVDNRILNILN